MKRNIFIIAMFAVVMIATLRTSEAHAEQAMESFEGHIKVGYHWISLDGGTRSGEYEYFQKSDALSAVIEWDRLPHRFLLEYHSLNEKDFFKSLDYSYGDMVVFNAISRRLFHNLDHYSFGPDDIGTSSPSFTDKNPEDRYFTQNTFNTFFLRLKTPDFPLHVYAEARSLEKEGTVQQRALIGYFTQVDKVSQSRDIDWRTVEFKAGANSHIGSIEADYSHIEKRFEALGQKVLYDSYPAAAGRAAGTYPHNLTPDLDSSSDTIKIHTSHTGRIVAAGTYTRGERENKDSGARIEYWNAAGDLTITPAKGLVFFFKYRHYDLSPDNPATATMAGLSNTYNVRESISSQRDVMTGTIKYRTTEGLTLKGEYSLEKMERDIGPAGNLPAPPTNAPAYWEVEPETTKKIGRIGVSYRVMKKVTARADYSHVEVDDPTYNFDPDKADTAKLSVTWSPSSKFTALVGYSGVREKREGLKPPLAGGDRETSRDQALGSVTVLVGKRSSITTSYAYFRNQADHTLTYNHSDDGSTYTLVMETGVPYDDVAHVGSILLTHALSDAAALTAEATKSFSRGSWRNSGFVSNTTGIAEFSDLKVVEDIYAAGMEVALGKDISAELRYRYIKYNDKINSANDGKTQIGLAYMSIKW